jgi:hypothetical protein
MKVQLKAFAASHRYLSPGTQNCAIAMEVLASSRSGDLLSQYGIPRKNLWPLW